MNTRLNTDNKSHFGVDWQRKCFFGGKYTLVCHFQKSFLGFVSGAFGCRSRALTQEILRNGVGAIGLFPVYYTELTLISRVFTFCVLHCVSSCNSFSALIAEFCGFLACGNTCSAEGRGRLCGYRFATFVIRNVIGNKTCSIVFSTIRFVTRNGFSKARN